MVEHFGQRSSEGPNLSVHLPKQFRRIAILGQIQLGSEAGFDILREQLVIHLLLTRPIDQLGGGIFPLLAPDHDGSLLLSTFTDKRFLPLLLAAALGPTAGMMNTLLTGGGRRLGHPHPTLVRAVHIGAGLLGPVLGRCVSDAIL